MNSKRWVTLLGLGLWLGLGSLTTIPSRTQPSKSSSVIDRCRPGRSDEGPLHGLGTEQPQGSVLITDMRVVVSGVVVSSAELVVVMVVVWFVVWLVMVGVG